MDAPITSVARRAPWIIRVRTTSHVFGSPRTWIERLEPRILFSGIGELDSTFGTAGSLSIDIVVGGEERIFDVFTDARGRIYLLGDSSIGVEENFIARLHSDGTLDSSFADAGIERVAYTSTPFIDASVGLYDGAVDQAGRVIVVGVAEDEIGSQVLVRRYLENGQPDPTFDRDGEARFDVTDDPIGRPMGSTVAIDSQGRIVVGGLTSLYEPEAFVGPERSFVLRVLPDGSLDPAFGARGVVEFAPPGGGDFVGRPVIDSQDRIIVAGRVSRDDPSNVIYGHTLSPAAVRLSQDGSVDADYADRGWWTHAFGPGMSWIGTPQIDSRDRVVAVFNSEDIRVAADGVIEYLSQGRGVFRLDAAGELDRRFHDDGTRDGEIDQVIVQPDDRILVREDGAARRYLWNGAADSSWRTRSLELLGSASIIDSRNRLIEASGLTVFDDPATPDQDEFGYRVRVTAVQLGPMAVEQTPSDNPIVEGEPPHLVNRATPQSSLPNWFSQSTSQQASVVKLLDDNEDGDRHLLGHS